MEKCGVSMRLSVYLCRGVREEKSEGGEAQFGCYDGVSFTKQSQRKPYLFEPLRVQFASL
jgi:hypothetical protein